MVEHGSYNTSSEFDLGHRRFLAEVLSGLRKPQKELPSKYFYDERGSILFERICALDEYYIPQTEESIMQAHISQISELIGPRALLIEFGSGDCKKVRFLLDNLNDPVAYIPIDISIQQLLRVTKELASDYPAVEVLPICADFMSSFDIPNTTREFNRTVFYFPGSTIGNFNPVAAKHFLERIAQICGRDGVLIIGVDLKKDHAVLHSAYNDKQDVTAAFNLNLLHRINRELACDFQVDSFKHYAFYNPKEGRIEMHLLSMREQSIHIDNTTVDFAQGETIWTESSYKYNLCEFEEIAAAAGFKAQHAWTDEQQWFSVQYLVTTGGSGY